MGKRAFRKIFSGLPIGAGDADLGRTLARTAEASKSKLS
jgi:hypothetical protein